MAARSEPFFTEGQRVDRRRREEGLVKLMARRAEDLCQYRVAIASNTMIGWREGILQA